MPVMELSKSAPILFGNCKMLAGDNVSWKKDDPEAFEGEDELSVESEDIPPVNTLDMLLFDALP